LERETPGSQEAYSLTNDAVAAIEKSRAVGTDLTFQDVNGLDWCAFAMFASGHPAAGLRMAEEALKSAEKTYGPDLPTTRDMNRTLGCIYLALGRTNDAVRVLEKAVGSQWAVVQVGPRIFQDIALLAAAHRELGNMAESRRVIDRALAKIESNSRQGVAAQPIIATVWCEVGFLSIAEGRFVEAEAAFRRALAEYERAASVQFPWQRIHPRARAVSGLGQALAGQGRFAEGESHAMQGFQELKSNRTALAGDQEKFVREAGEAVARLYQAWGKTEAAAQWQQTLSKR
jgi:tetratricopeptide (TPR) repeat protein